VRFVCGEIAGLLQTCRNKVLHDVVGKPYRHEYWKELCKQCFAFVLKASGIHERQRKSEMIKAAVFSPISSKSCWQDLT